MFVKSKIPWILLAFFASRILKTLPYFRQIADCEPTAMKLILKQSLQPDNFKNNQNP